eukprot:TRINITY_DN1960_c0_g4_i1.p1 TRINITY_DN1960_c0_g4~~TRINITY_DN1960_c0_g4_i1.p1  ORF type:complete len:927 (+),score=367.14 TRINITY_DN1960_c0_g4_i1:91-2781(+)
MVKKRDIFRDEADVVPIKGEGAGEAKAKKKNKIMVSGLPQNADKQLLEDLFTTIGPVRRCFVITEKGSTQCTGMGFVHFAIEEDAAKAMKKLQGHRLPRTSRRLIMEWAKPRRRGEDDEGEAPEKKPRRDPVPKKNDPLRTITVTLVALGEGDKSEAGDLFAKHQELVRKRARKSGNPSKIIQLDGSNSIEILFATEEGANKAAKDMNGKLLTAGVQMKASSRADGVRSRLIVRNIPFETTKRDIAEKFRKYGQFAIHLPDGGSKRFVFLQFEHRADAQEAMEKENLTELRGRPVAIDWALPKDMYMKQRALEEVDDDGERTVKKEADTQGGDSSEGEEEDDEEELGEVDFDVDDDDDIDDDDDEEEEGDMEDFDSEEEGEGGYEDEDAMDEEEWDSEGGEDGEDEDEEEDEDDTRGRRAKSKVGDFQGRKSKPPPDVQRGTTLFVRNIAYDTEEDALYERFIEYGKIKHAVLTRDRETGRPRGSGFVNFFKRSSVEAVLAEAYPRGLPTSSLASERTSNMTLDGRPLIIDVAVDRDKAKEFSDTHKKERQDKRNLYLLHEGLVKAGEPGSEGVSKSDLDKRQAGFRERKEKLKNPNFFVSRTRLSCRNLPTELDESGLKEIFKKAAKKAPVLNAAFKQVKIIRGPPHNASRGYGFIEIEPHEMALELLRRVNNNPFTFEKTKRPIVEFAVEDARVIHKKEKVKEFVQRRKEQRTREKEELEKRLEKEKEEKRSKKKVDPKLVFDDEGNKLSNRERKKRKTERLRENRQKVRDKRKERKRKKEQGDEDGGTAASVSAHTHHASGGADPEARGGRGADKRGGAPKAVVGKKRKAQWQQEQTRKRRKGTSGGKGGGNGPADGGDTFDRIVAQRAAVLDGKSAVKAAKKSKKRWFEDEA